MAVVEYGLAHPPVALGRFVLLSSLSGVGIGLAKIGLVLHGLSLNASALELGLIAGAQTTGLLLASLPCGLLIERLGPRRLYLMGSLLAALACQGLAELQQALPLMLMSLLLGLCMPCRLVALNAVFMQQLAFLKPSQTGWLRGAQMIGILLIGPPLAASLFALLGTSGSWPLIGLVFACPILLAWKVLPGRSAQSPGAEALSLTALQRQLGLLRQEPDLRANGVLDFCVQASAQFFSFFMVAITVQDLGWSAYQAACLVTVHGLAFILALFFLGRLLAEFPQVGRSACLLLSVVALLTLGLTDSASLVWLSAVLLGISLGLLQVVTLARYAEHGRQLGHGRIAGLAVLIGPSGSLAGCLLGAALGGWIGLQPLFLLFVPVFIAFALQGLRPIIPARFVFRRIFDE